MAEQKTQKSEVPGFWVGDTLRLNFGFRVEVKISGSSSLENSLGLEESREMLRTMEPELYAKLERSVIEGMRREVVRIVRARGAGWTRKKALYIAEGIIFSVKRIPVDD